MIEFGWMSTTLAVGAAHGIVTIVLLIFAAGNRIANRFLALLIVLITLQVVPYIIGFAGYYDAYPGLSYLPVYFSMGYGPALYFYVRQITAEHLPPKWQWHFLPMAAQCLYYAVIFIQPLAFKNGWDSNVHVPWIDPAESLLIFLSFGFYLVRAWRQQQRYQAWLDANLSNREEFRLTWLSTFLALLGITLGLWIGFQLFDMFVRDMNYFGWFWLYVWLALLIYMLGLLGWRNANLVYPRAVTAEPEQPEPRQRDWSDQARSWAEQIATNSWWRDPDITLNELARKLGSNSSYVSRALNEGLGETFNGFINRLRVEAVKAAIAQGDSRDLLSLALEAGFNSKASFNRAFKTVTGTTPSQNRQEIAARRLTS